VSTLLFATAGQVVADQGLLTTPCADLRDRRAAFRSELGGILVDLDTVESLAREQFVERAPKFRCSGHDGG
jgi:glycerol-3-phosphate O-acyltransferase